MLALVNVFLVFISAVIARIEGRFDHYDMGPKSLPWVAHGGNWADLVLITILCYIANPHTRTWTPGQMAIAVVVGIIVSIGMHVAYYFMQPIPGHIIDTHYKGLARFGLGGLYHCFYTVWAFAIIFLFFVFTPGAPRLGACIVMTLFVPLAIWEPGWYNAKMINGKGIIDAAGWIQAIIIWAIIWGVGYTRP